MRWKKHVLADGDRRIRRSFLLLPKTINGETRWLEWAAWIEELQMGVSFDGPYQDWNEIFWMEE